MNFQKYNDFLGLIESHKEGEKQKVDKEVYQNIASLCSPDIEVDGFCGEGGEAFVLRCMDNLNRLVSLKVFYSFVSFH